MNYDNYNYISSGAIVAKVKQQLKSYFDSGSVTDVLIPTYIDNALRKLRYLILQEKEDIIDIENYKGVLPDDFSYLNNAYLCETVKVLTNPNFSSYSEWYRTVGCGTCVDRCVCDREVLDTVSVRTAEHTIVYKRGAMVKVYYGSKNYCLDNSKSLQSTSELEIKIDKKTVSTNFASGSLYITYLTRPMDEYGPLIPEIIEVEEFVEACIVFEIFDQLMNSITDESQNQIFQKRQLYYANKLAKFQSARNFLLQETKQQMRDSLYNQRRRLRKYNIYE